MLYWSPIVDVAQSVRTLLSAYDVHVQIHPHAVHVSGAVPHATRLSTAIVQMDGTVRWFEGNVAIVVTPNPAGPDVEESALRLLVVAARRLGQLNVNAVIRRSITHRDVEISLHGATATLAMMIAPESASWSTAASSSWCAWRLTPSVQLCAYATHADLEEV